MGIIKDVKIRGLSIPFDTSVETTWSKRDGTTTFLVELTTDKGLKGYGEMVAFFPADGVDEEVYYEDYTQQPTDEAIPFFDVEGESELTHTPAEGETPAEEEKPTEDDKQKVKEEKKSYTPYIVGGVVLLGAIGTYVYMNRDK